MHMPRYSEALARSGGRGRKIQENAARGIAQKQAASRDEQAWKYRRGEVDKPPRPTTVLDKWATEMEKAGKQVVDLTRVWQKSGATLKEARKPGEPPRGWMSLAHIAFELQEEIRREGKKFDMEDSLVKSTFAKVAAAAKDDPANADRFGLFMNPVNPDDPTDTEEFKLDFFHPRLAVYLKQAAAAQLRV